MPSRCFPSPQSADQDGLLCVGGSLSPARLLDAYRHGIFPWPSTRYEPMLWWSPDPRAILPLGGLYVSRRLSRRLRSGEFRFTVNEDFPAVIEACSEGPGREGGTWLTGEMIDAYCQLHCLGHAHSVETWTDDRLVGGVYGVSIGGFFAAESMFHRRRDASKAALAFLVERLAQRGFELLDVQMKTPHTSRLGAVDIPRNVYLRRLAAAVEMPATFVDPPAEPSGGET